MKYLLKNANKFSWNGLDGYAYNSKEDFANASAAYFEVTSEHGKVKTTKSDRVYYIIEGKGEFEIDNELIDVEQSDVVIVPKNTPYNYRSKKGLMKLFLVHTPAFDPDKEIKLDE